MRQQWGNKKAWSEKEEATVSDRGLFNWVFNEQICSKAKAQKKLRKMKPKRSQKKRKVAEDKNPFSDSEEDFLTEPFTSGEFSTGEVEKSRGQPRKVKGEAKHVPPQIEDLFENDSDVGAPDCKADEPTKKSVEPEASGEKRGLSQGLKNKVAANRARAIKAKRAKTVGGASSCWHIESAPELKTVNPGGDPLASASSINPEEAQAVKEQLKKFEKDVAERNLAITKRQEAEEEAKQERWSKANDRNQTSTEATENADKVNEECTLGGGGPRDIWAEMCTAEAVEAERAAAEEADRKARQASCDAFEEELIQGKGRGNPKEGRSQGKAPKEEAAPPRPAALSTSQSTSPLIKNGTWRWCVTSSIWPRLAKKSPGPKALTQSSQRSC